MITVVEYYFRYLSAVNFYSVELVVAYDWK